MASQRHPKRANFVSANEKAKSQVVAQFVRIARKARLSYADFLYVSQQSRKKLGLRPPKKERKLPLLLQNAASGDLQLAHRHESLLVRLAGVDRPQAVAPGTKPPPAAAALVGELTLLVPMAGLIDPAAELARLNKKIKKTKEEIARAQAKLGNEKFIQSAPAAVVAQERERLASFEQALGGLGRHLEQVRALQS